ncbi:hypothetical protein C8R45DRAFT_960948 [Mycena sanguinolenta]|nr:hypothetical protein C8R45DRAFT_960948 [Mycena sanguinolenta]
MLPSSSTGTSNERLRSSLLPLVQLLAQAKARGQDSSQTETNNRQKSAPETNNSTPSTSPQTKKPNPCIGPLVQLLVKAKCQGALHTDAASPESAPDEADDSIPSTPESSTMTLVETEPLAASGAAKSQAVSEAAAKAASQAALQAALEEAIPAALKAALQASLEAALPPLLARLEPKIDDLRIFMRKNYNLALGDGRAVPFEAVPFPDGTMPSTNSNTPTALTNVDVIETLTTSELTEYCNRYYPGRIYEGSDERTRKIKDLRVAIGCGANVVSRRQTLQTVDAHASLFL